MADWQPAATAPADRVIMTKIDDERGARNEGALYRDGALWWAPDGSMYVYYQPTHWRELTPAERRRETGVIVARIDNAAALGAVALKRLQ